MRKCVTLILTLMAAISCSRPSSYEPFMVREKAEYGDTYSFNLDLSDSTLTYSLDFYTRLGRRAFSAYSADSLELGIRWVSPSDSSFFEYLTLRMDEPVDSSYYSRDFIFPFRDTLKLPEWGQWRLRVQVRNNPDGLRGLGIIFKNNDGTR